MTSAKFGVDITEKSFEELTTLNLYCKLKGIKISLKRIMADL
jgi:hypothetical protein